MASDDCCNLTSCGWHRLFILFTLRCTAKFRVFDGMMAQMVPHDLQIHKKHPPCTDTQHMGTDDFLQHLQVILVF